MREHFGDIGVPSLTAQDLDSFILARKIKVKDKTVNGDLIILRAALNNAVAVGLIDSLPFKIRMLKVSRRKIQRVLTPAEIQTLLESASQHRRGSAARYYGILLVATHTGFRTDEILHLQWKDIYWEDGSLHITTKDGVWSSKNHQERSVFVSQWPFP